MAMPSNIRVIWQTKKSDETTNVKIGQSTLIKSNEQRILYCHTWKCHVLYLELLAVMISFGVLCVLPHGVPQIFLHFGDTVSSSYEIVLDNAL